MPSSTGKRNENSVNYWSILLWPSLSLTGMTDKGDNKISQMRLGELLKFHFDRLNVHKKFGLQFQTGIPGPKSNGILVNLAMSTFGISTPFLKLFSFFIQANHAISPSGKIGFWRLVGADEYFSQL